LVNLKDSAGIDLFIGEADLLYKGFGPLIRAYEKVGFRPFKSADTLEGPVYLMKL